MKIKRLLSIVLCFCLALSLAACTKVDKNSGESDKNEPIDEYGSYINIELPNIMSDDEVMPTFFDITLYDEENYSKIYLGTDYEYNFIYGGVELKLPSDLSSMTKSGWSIVDKDKYNEDIKLGVSKSLKIDFVNSSGKQIKVQFYNPSNASLELKNCKIVKFIIPQNVSLVAGSVYDEFSINGINNKSAITDVVELLGAPSHFYAQNENDYYLDYFLTAKDKRSKIRVYVDTQSDNITALEISKY